MIVVAVPTGVPLEFGDKAALGLQVQEPLPIGHGLIPPDRATQGVGKRQVCRRHGS
jgi:hypothetical protein